MTIPDPTERFGDRAEIYSLYRPGYPPEFLEFLTAECGLHRHSVVADIGSGSGQLTRLLVDRASIVYAVEPNAGMRRMAENNLSHREGFVSISGTAEATGLKARSVNFVTAAQAFHWFNVEEFAEEARRIARPGARGLLVWNMRVEAPDGFMGEYKRILLRHCKERHLITERRDDPGRLTRFYRGAKYLRRSFEYRQLLDFPGFVGRVCSSSYTPRPGEPAHQAMLDELRDLYSRSERNGVVTLEYETRAYVGALNNT